MMINYSYDIAYTAGAGGVQLTSQSLLANVARRLYGPEFLIGVSAHSLEAACDASRSGADFVVFGPVFETESKRAYGPPQGLGKLREIAEELHGFPVVA